MRGTRVKLHVGFLLGAGISVPAAPSTEIVTRTVLQEGNKYYVHSDDRWYERTSSTMALPQNDQRELRVTELLSHLSGRVEEYYGSRCDPVGCPVRSCTYEDLAYLADSLANTLTRNRDDPGLMPFAADLEQRFGWSSETLKETAEDTVAFIRAVVYSKLITVEPPPNHLRLLIDAAQDEELPQISIYTLNHDCLIEDLFEAQGIELFDFRRSEKRSHRVRLDMQMAIPKGARAVLMKPHGSVRWRRYRPLGRSGADPWRDEWIGWDTDEEGARHDDNNRWRSDGEAQILVGRFNKELDYLDEPYWQIFLAVTQSLRNIEQVVVSGYSFGDKAINSLLINWVYSRPQGERRVVVMHEDQQRLLDGARGAIREKWEIWSETRVLRFVPKFPRDYSWPELKKILLTS